ncbi:M81 family metallopeptidase [Congregibacter sp.]|uniref:M81 family metallopeptidase n=1 Tax=Congregibacter sp. TaxID=2744308 RepID=UPI003F6A9AF1
MIRFTQWLLIAALGIALAGCGEAEEPTRNVAPMPTVTTTATPPEPVRIAVLRFSHETCTFCPGGDVTMADWTKIRDMDVGDEVLTAGGYTKGFTSAMGEYQGVELIGLTSPPGVYGGSSRSWSTRETFEEIMAGQIADLEAAMPVDGVYLAMHGAMAVRGIPRPEAEVAKRIRQVVGPDVPIAATFDLHANEDEEFLKWADISLVIKRYPHYDTGLQGERAARLLLRTIRGSFDPTGATRRPGIVTPTVLQWTGRSPYMDIYERARRWESRETDVFVSVALGFPWSDVPDLGANIQVITNNDQALADRIADDMNEYMWRVREQMFDTEMLMPEEAVSRAIADIEGGVSPVVLADYSDRNGDATWILDEIVKQGLSGVLYGTVRDELVIQQLLSSEAQPGDAFDMPVGGFAADSSGKPVQITGTLSYLGEGLGYETIAIVEFGEGNSLIITPALRQIIWTEQLEVGGLDPDDFKAFVTKSRVHFRRGFDETGYSPSIYIVDAPGGFVGTVRLDSLSYDNVELTDLYPYGTPPDRR